MAPITIDEALSRFLDAQRQRLAPRTFRNYDEVIGLLRDCMNGYGSTSPGCRRAWTSAARSSGT